MKIKSILIPLLSLLMVMSPCYSQEGDAGAAGTEEDIFEQSMQDVIIVGAFGGFGALLGLSTLSFVDEPKEHLNNIVVGGAVGIILGVGLVAYLAATKSSKIYEKSSFDNRENAEKFSTAMRHEWHRKNHFEFGQNLGRQSFASKSPFQVNLSF